MEKYVELIENDSNELKSINRKHYIVGYVRLTLILVIAFLIYLWFLNNQVFIIGICIFCIVLFLYLLKLHDKLSWQKQLKNELIKINQSEIEFLQEKSIPFKNGAEYINPKHFYSFDLDFFGNNSLYQHLNRCGTYIGEKSLSEILLSHYSKDEILNNQMAIKEMTHKIEWRQKINAIANLTKDTKKNYDQLMLWMEREGFHMNKVLFFFTYFNPVILSASVLLFVLFNNPVFVSIASLLFGLNIIIVFFQYKKIKSEVDNFDKIHEIFKKYSLILAEIESQNFNSVKLKNLKTSLLQGEIAASKKIKTLSKLFEQLDSINNLPGAILINGLFLYHLRILNNITRWKKNYAQYIQTWLNAIGSLEAINCFANSYYNNSDFIFPEINNDLTIKFENVGHPLINKNKRVNNSIEFINNKLTILTGSNMSGKSTFLRTLGVNLVLTGIGSPICAQSANINPLNVLVSMRQNDSLSDDESYFFSELKRLKSIFDFLNSNTGFVLLDEILKGTNSQDKQTGTIGVIENLISKNAIGVIATHDLDVCATTNRYPEYLINRCFEVEIIDDNLFFDYKIKNGICKNKSASFLMKKMNIL